MTHRKEVLDSFSPETFYCHKSVRVSELRPVLLNNHQHHVGPVWIQINSLFDLQGILTVHKKQRPSLSAPGRPHKVPWGFQSWTPTYEAAALHQNHRGLCRMGPRVDGRSWMKNWRIFSDSRATRTQTAAVVFWSSAHWKPVTVQFIHHLIF